MDQGRNKIVGKWGEDQACLFLARQGFAILDRNFYTTRGEIDIVAAKSGDYYFIEVKTRQAGELANDLAITKTKLHKLKKTILAYCYRKNIAERSLITAGLLVIFDRQKRHVSFRLAAYC